MKRRGDTCGYTKVESGEGFNGSRDEGKEAGADSNGGESTFV